MIYSTDFLATGAVNGFQAPIVGTLLTVAGNPTTADVAGTKATPADVALAGRTLGAGTYYFFIPAGGALAIDVTLRASANATNIDAANTKVYYVLRDGVTEKLNVLSASDAIKFINTFANGVQQTASLTGLRGVRGVLLKLVLTGSVTFDQAESSAL